MHVAAKNLKTIYEDDQFIALNKPAEISVENILSEMSPKCYMVHRLDLNTTGVFVLAKSPKSADLFRRSHVEKYYLNVCEGNLGKEPEIWNAHLFSQEGVTRKVKVYKQAIEGSKPCQQIVQGISSEKKFSVGIVKLITGRKHQIRAMFAHRKLPLLGDHKYGNSRFFKRQALHATMIRLTNPSGDYTFSVIAEPPSDFISCLKMGGYLWDQESFKKTVKNLDDCGLGLE